VSVVVSEQEYVGPQLWPKPYSRANIAGFAPPRPAAGADISFTVPNGVMWDVVSVIGTLTASAAAANRLVGWIVKNQEGTTVYQYNMTAALTAGLNATFCYSENTSSVPSAIATTNHLLMPQPVPWIPAGWTFGTNTTNIDVGDQWSAVGIWVQVWLPNAGS
jgi:hypothetical protein